MTKFGFAVSFAFAVVFAFAIVFGSPIVSAASGGDSPQWITVADPPRPNQWLAFRRDFELTDPASLQMAIAVDSKYWLWIDGQMVVREGGLKRGPTPDDTYIDTVRPKRALAAGKHQIAVLVWYFGKHGFSHNDSGRGGLYFEAAATPESQSGPGSKSESESESSSEPGAMSGSDPAMRLLNSDDRWVARVHPAFGQTGPPHPNFRLPESNIHFDARQDLDGWLVADVKSLPWPAAIPVGPAGCRPWGELVDRPIPLFKDFGVAKYANQDALNLPRISDGTPIRCRLPYNAQVTPVMHIVAPEGVTIGIQTDNYRGGSAPNVRCQYITRSGDQTYENLGWFNGHEVIYDIPAGVTVQSLSYRQTGYATEPTGRFECDDEFLNRLRQKAVRTLYITMRDTYVDCPDRERAQWFGDAVLELGEAFYAMDRRSDLLAKKGIAELMGWQRDDHTIFSPIPAGNYHDELPMQMLASVGRYGIWTYALHSGDLQTVADVYDRVGDYLSLWQIGDDGLVVPRKGGWTWGDWGNHKDMPLLFSGWYCLALDGRREMARALGRDDDVAILDRQITSLRFAFNRTYWNGTQYRSPGHLGETDDRGHALAVVAGIADPSQYDAITEILRRQRHSSPYMEKYVLEALYKMRRPTVAIERMKQRYAAMVQSDLTTLWEGWGIGNEGFGGGTINHAWSGGPLTILSQFAVGIQPTSPGYKTIQIDPQLGPLQFATATVDSVAGVIRVDVRRTDDQTIVKVDCPTGVTGVVVQTNGQKTPFQAGRTVIRLQ